jgi:tRNA pseudouridine55 synthase
VKRRGAKVDGWIVVDKPAGISSFGAVAAVRRAFGAAKAGHGGTLDPLATGVLVVALGEATKLLPFVMDAAKRYRFTVRWGEARATDDAEGAVVATSPVRPDRAAIAAALPRFVGTIRQTPPAYSAIKVDGQRAYARARAGEAVVLQARPVTISRFVLDDAPPDQPPDPDHAAFTVDCGKGTYVRSLARDLAAALGTVGHVVALRRLAVGRFRAEDAISLDKLEALGHSPARSATLRPVETALDDIPALAVTETAARRLRLGQVVPLAEAHGSPPCDASPDATVAVLCEGRLVALATVAAGGIRPVRVINP